MTDTVIKHLLDQNNGNFAVDEFLEHRDKLERPVIEEIAQFRNWTGWPTQITSAWRHSGSHSTGFALDILMWKEWKKQPTPMEMWRRITHWPWLGVGIYFDWNDGIGFHVDVIRTERPRPKRWIRLGGRYYYQSPKTGIFFAENGQNITLMDTIRKHGHRS